MIPKNAGSFVARTAKAGCGIEHTAMLNFTCGVGASRQEPKDPLALNLLLVGVVGIIANVPKSSNISATTSLAHKTN